MECETARRIHTMFEHWAARTPEADAAVDAMARLSDGELDVRANRLARHLRGPGHGGILVLCPQEVLADPAALESRLSEARIDIADVVPAALDALNAHVDAHGRDLGFMRTIVCGPDRWSVEEADRARRVVGDGVHLLEAYGLTETSVDSACCEIAPLAADILPASPPLSSVLRDLFSVDLSLRRWFEAPTIEALVEAMLDASVKNDATRAEAAADVSAEDTEAIV